MQGLKEEWEQHELSETDFHAVPSKQKMWVARSNSNINTVIYQHWQRVKDPDYSQRHPAPTLCLGRGMCSDIYEIFAPEINKNGVLIHDFGKTKQKESLLSKGTCTTHWASELPVHTFDLWLPFYREKTTCLTITHHKNEINFLSLKLWLSLAIETL